MKRLLVTLALVLIAVPALAALQYDFIQKHTSDDSVAPSRDLSGRATIDGARTRVDFVGGNLYPPGTYVVSSDASRRLFFVDPTNKWYTEVNTSGIASAIAATDIKITNLASQVEPRTDKAMIAGIEATHQRLNVDFDIVVTMKSIPMKMHARIEIDSWTTEKFGTVHQSFIADTMRTGNTAVDQLLSKESSAIRGFPLRRTVTIRTTSAMPSRSKQLEVPTSRTTTRETLVTSIRETPAEAALFIVPATYRRSDQPDLSRTTTQVLTFEPVTK